MNLVKFIVRSLWNRCRNSERATNAIWTWIKYVGRILLSKVIGFNVKFKHGVNTQKLNIWLWFGIFLLTHRFQLQFHKQNKTKIICTQPNHFTSLNYHIKFKQFIFSITTQWWDFFILHKKHCWQWWVASKMHWSCFVRFCWILFWVCYALPC